MSEAPTSQNPEEETGLQILDKAWEKQQEKTFTAWTNSHLRKVNTKIDNISADFRDGKKLTLLLEVISNERLPRVEKGNLRLHYVNNVNACLHFISQKGVKLAGIGAEEIVDGNLKMTLGMIWTIILRFAISVVGEGNLSAKEGLLLWVQKKTEGYKNVNVQNFTNSWKDGLAFNALIHAHRPDLLDYDALRKETPKSNLVQAFQIAEDKIDIPKMLDPDDVLLCPDEKSVMTYVACFYHAFSSSQQVQNAAKKVSDVISTNLENQHAMEEYEKLTTDLLQWIGQKIPELNERDDNPSLEYIKDRLAGFGDYKRGEKPPRFEQKNKLENTYNKLRTRLHLMNRQEYTPADGFTLKDVDDKWKNLEKSEKELSDWLSLMLKKLEQLEHYDKKFKYKCDQQDMWTKGKDERLSREVTSFSLSEVSALLKQFSAFKNEIQTRQNRIDTITSIRDKLQKLNYSKIGEINERYESVMNTWNVICDLAKKYEEKLTERHEYVKKLDDLYSEFATKAPSFKCFLDDYLEDVNDTFTANTVKDVEELKEQHEQFVKDVHGKEPQLAELKKLVSEAKAMCSDPNPYSDLDIEDMDSNWGVLSQDISRRSSLLDQEMARQISNEKLMKDFGSRAEEINDWKNQMLQQLHDVFPGSGVSKTLEQERDSLNALGHQIEEYYKVKIVEIEELNTKLHGEGIYFNPYSSHTTESLAAGYQQLINTLSASLTAVENQILVRDSSNITEAKVNELRKSFNHFDRHKIGHLLADEFRAFLVSETYHVSADDSAGEKEFNRICSKCDPENTTKYTFNNFLNFVASENKNTDSAEQIIDSLSILAGGKEYITPDVIHKEFSKQHAEYLLANMQPSTVSGAPPDALDYRSFAGSLYGESDL